MNRKVKYGIGIIAIMIFCFIYSNVDKMSDMYENKLDNSQYITVQVDEEHAVEQRFHAAEEKVSGIALKIMLQNAVSYTHLDVYKRQGYYRSNIWT